MSAAIDTATRASRPSTGGHAIAFFSPLGVTLRVKASHPQLIEAVASACRGWEMPADPHGPILHLWLRVGPVAVDGTGPAIRTDGRKLTIRGDIEASADAERGHAWCRVANAASFDDAELRERVLDSLILWLLTRNGRTPIHASGFVVGTRAVLMAGPSGSGKSCLALAAHSAGYRLLSDDTVYLELEHQFRVWGIPRPVHLFAEDVPPQEQAPIRLRNGKHKRAIALPMPAQPVTANAATLCVLRRGDHVSLEPIDAATALVELGPLEPGFDLLAPEIAEGLGRVTRHGAWRLTLGPDPHEAIALLSANLPRMVERAGP